MKKWEEKATNSEKNIIKKKARESKKRKYIKKSGEK